MNEKGKGGKYRGVGFSVVRMAKFPPKCEKMTKF